MVHCFPKSMTVILAEGTNAGEGEGYKIGQARIPSNICQQSLARSLCDDSNIRVLLFSIDVHEVDLESKILEELEERCESGHVYV